MYLTKLIFKTSSNGLKLGFLTLNTHLPHTSFTPYIFHHLSSDELASTIPPLSANIDGQGTPLILILLLLTLKGSQNTQFILPYIPEKYKLETSFPHDQTSTSNSIDTHAILGSVCSFLDSVS